MRPIERALAGLLALGLATMSPAMPPAQEASKSEAGLRPSEGVGVNPQLGQAALEQMAQGQRVCVVAVAVATIKSRVVTGTQVAKGCKSAQEPGVQPIFQVASLSKPVFAYAVIKLAQQGRINLDAPLMRYLPKGYDHVQNPGDNTHSPLIDAVTVPELQSVTARMVLNHTSGLPNWSRGPLTFDFQPGTRWQYSGEAYVLLQSVVEAITGTRLDVFMREQVFAPLRMEHSDYVWSQRLEAEYVPGTTAHGKSLAWGLGWGIEAAPNDDQFIWHWGNNPGYRAFVMASVQSGGEAKP